MVKNVNLVFGLLNWQDLTNPIYQTQLKKNNPLNQILSFGTNHIYRTESIEPNLPNIYTKLYLQNQIYEAEYLKCKEPNVLNQIYQTKSIELNLQTKSTWPSLPNQK